MKKMALNMFEELPDPGPNLFSKLPDSNLIDIISKLPADDAVRTGILSKRWKSLWRYVSNLDFDPIRMMKSSNQLLFQERMTQRASIGFFHPDLKKHICHAIMMISKVMFSHRCNLISCKIIHFPDWCNHDQLQKWIEFLISKKAVQELAFICEVCPDIPANMRRNFELKCLNLPSGIFSCTKLHALELTGYKLEDHSPFDNCLNLKTLKLKKAYLSAETLDGIISSCGNLEHLSLCLCKGFDRVRIVSDIFKTVELESLEVNGVYLSTESLAVLVLHTLRCPSKNLIINAPKLRVFHAYCNPIHKNPYQDCNSKHKNHRNQIMIQDPDDKVPLKVAEILEHCSGLLRHENSQGYDDDHPNGNSTMFDNLWKLCIDLDLNNIREVLILSYTLRVCTHLQQLEINIQETREEATSNQPYRSILPYPESMLWDKREICDCITHTLTQVSIKGFEGRERELEFVRHLITKGAVMKRISIWCDDNCSRYGAEATLKLLSLPRSSINVSIDPKPGPQYDSANGASFKQWILTLE